MERFNKTLGARVRKMREEIGLSQEKLAGMLGMSRVSLSQMENGERKIVAEEITKLAKIFNIQSDVLLNLKEDVKIEIKEEQEKKPVKDELRISVPQKNIRKFKEVLLYILKKVGSKPNIGESVIYKLLYFIDFNYYEKCEEQLIGATYMKNTYGPTPKEFKRVVEDMENKGELLKLEDKYFQYPQRKYLPLRQPDLSVLRGDEEELIDDVLDKYSDMNASQISEFSHNDVPWLTTKDGEVIDYESVFYRTAPYSVRSYSDDNL